MDDVDTPPMPDGPVVTAEPDGDAAAVQIVLREIGELRVAVAREHDRAEARELTITRLHEENQRLRAGELQLLLRPLLTDLQRLRHELVRTATTLPEHYSGAQTADLLRSYADNLELTLERAGVAVVVPEIGIAFDPSRHRAAGVLPAASPEQDATVAEVLLDGYHDVQTGRTMMPAAVRVHRWSVTGPDQAHQPS